MSTPTLGSPIADARLAERVLGRMAEVEDRLGEAVGARDPFVSEVASHLLAAGGKRFRPLLVLLASEFGDADAPGVVPSALVVELTHVATLYHDDVMDEAALRRGSPSANARWDNSVAILTGDYLFARASSIVADLGTDAVKLQAETFARLVQGQIRETQGPAEGVDPLDHYLQVVSDKTGSLIATSARFGALMAGAPPEVCEALTTFGERVGAAFQLSDDVIDVASETDDTGKTPGTDLREGVLTLPTLLAARSLRHESGPDAERLAGLLARPVTDEAEVAETLALLRAHPSLDDARRVVRRETDAAREVLEAGVPACPARDALAAVCDTVTTRLG